MSSYRSTKEIFISKPCIDQDKETYQSQKMCFLIESYDKNREAQGSYNNTVPRQKKTIFFQKTLAKNHLEMRHILLKEGQNVNFDIHCSLCTFESRSLQWKKCKVLIDTGFTRFVTVASCCHTICADVRSGTKNAQFCVTIVGTVANLIIVSVKILLSLLVTCCFS